MKSCLYEGVVVHRRHTPIVRTFSYRLFLTYIDLAEVDMLFGRRGLWSMRFPAPSLYRRDDYLGPFDIPLDEAVRRLVAQRTGARPAGPIRLLTNLRSFGVRMNPVSFYFCYDASDRHVETLVAEVTNTPWGERHAYVMPYPCDAAMQEDAYSPKQLHVSPFLSMEMSYRWRLSEPTERLSIGIENMAADGKPFEAAIALTRVPLTRAARWWMTLKYPLQTWRIAAAIYWQALLIRRCGVPFVPHPATSAEAGATSESSQGRRFAPHDNNPSPEHMITHEV